MERTQSKVFAYSVRNSVRAVFFENVSFQKLRELKCLLKNFHEFGEIIEPLRVESEEFKSERLRQLVRYKEEGGLLPYLEEAIQEFEFLVVWKKASGGDEDIPEPKQGLDENFDSANEYVNTCKEKLNLYLQHVRAQLYQNNQGMSNQNKILNHVHYTNSRYRYEIEVPVDLVKGKKKPADFVLSSQKTGVQRFQTDQLKALIEELEEAEENLKNAISPFVCALF